MKDHRSNVLNFSSWEKRAWKKIQAWTGIEPMTSVILVQRSNQLTELSIQLEAGHLWVREYITTMIFYIVHQVIPCLIFPWSFFSTKLNKVVLHSKSFGYDCKGCSFVTCLLDNIDRLAFLNCLSWVHYCDDLSFA